MSRSSLLQALREAGRPPNSFKPKEPKPPKKPKCDGANSTPADATPATTPQVTPDETDRGPELPDTARTLWVSSMRATHNTETCSYCISKGSFIKHNLCIECTICLARFRSKKAFLEHSCELGNVDEDSFPLVIQESTAPIPKHTNPQSSASTQRICNGNKRKREGPGKLLTEEWPDLEKALRASRLETTKSPTNHDSASSDRDSPRVTSPRAPGQNKRKDCAPKLDCQTWPGLKKALKVSEMHTKGIEAPADARGLPRLWPDNVEYVSNNLADAEMWRLCKISKAPTLIPNVEIKAVGEQHVCYQKGRECFGLYATNNLRSGTVIGNYAGLVKRRLPDDSSQYLLSFLSEEESGIKLDIDAESFGNETRFINDFHGIASAPNCKYQIYDDETRMSRAARVVVISAIAPGEELLCDYGGFFNISAFGTDPLSAEQFFRCRPDDTPLAVSQLLDLDVKELIALNSTRFPELRQGSRFKDGTTLVLPKGELTEEQRQRRWALQLVAGDRVDCLDQHNVWSTAVVVGRKNGKLKVHFTGFRCEFDELIPEDEIEARLAPRKTKCEENAALVVEGGAKARAAAILAMREQEGREEYLVHWEGYSEDDATWETIQSMLEEHEGGEEVHLSPAVVESLARVAREYRALHHKDPGTQGNQTQPKLSNSTEPLAVEADKAVEAKPPEPAADPSPAPASQVYLQTR